MNSKMKDITLLAAVYITAFLCAYLVLSCSTELPTAPDEASIPPRTPNEAWYDVTVTCRDAVTLHPLPANISVWLEPNIPVTFTCLEDGISETRSLNTNNALTLRVTGVVSGDVCPVSPCQYASFSGSVALQSPMVTPRTDRSYSYGDFSKLLPVMFEPAVAR